MSFCLDATSIADAHPALNFERVRRNCELNAAACFKSAFGSGDTRHRPALDPARYTFDGAIWLDKDFFYSSAPEYLLRSRRSLIYGGRAILRGTRYSISANPTFEVRQKLDDIYQDFVEGVEALTGINNQIYALAVADYIKNAAVTFLNSLISGEKVGKLAFSNPAYQSLRRDACHLVQASCDLFYGLLISNRDLYSNAFSRLSDNGELVMHEIENRILHEYREGTFSSRHITRPEASHPLIFGGFAISRLLKKSSLDAVSRT